MIFGTIETYLKQNFCPVPSDYVLTGFTTLRNMKIFSEWGEKKLNELASSNV